MTKCDMRRTRGAAIITGRASPDVTSRIRPEARFPVRTEVGFGGDGGVRDQVEPGDQRLGLGVWRAFIRLPSVVWAIVQG